MSSFKFKRVKFAYERQIPCFYSPVRVFKTSKVRQGFSLSVLRTGFEKKESHWAKQ